ncbi:MAG: PIG-L family deacetylase [Nitrospira sp.]|nr:PIG-L family deacetylase [Nitrospira sp.]
MPVQGIFQVPHKPLKVLCLGAHSDDIEIGCGGTVLKLLREHPGSEVLWVIFSARGKRKQEAMSSAKAYLAQAGSARIEAKSFKESFFPYHGEVIKEYFESLKLLISPDIIFTHYRHDCHQDHRIICELTWNTFRRHQILEFEIPKYDGDLGQPNLYVPLTDAVCKTKVKLLMTGFSSQRSRQWFTEDTFYALLRLRGIESYATEKYAEAFYGRKIVIG